MALQTIITDIRNISDTVSFPAHKDELKDAADIEDTAKKFFGWGESGAKGESSESAERDEGEEGDEEENEKE